MEQDHPLGVLGQGKGFVCRRVASANHCHGLAHVQRPVASSAVGHPAPEEFLLSRNTQRPQRGAGGHYHGFAKIAVSAITGDPQVFTVRGHAGRRVHQHLDAGVHRLFLGGGSEFIAGDPLGKTGIVLDPFQVDDLSARHHLLHDGGIQTVPRRVDAGGQASHAAADDNYVVVFFGHLNYLIAGW